MSRPHNDQRRQQEASTLTWRDGLYPSVGVSFGDFRQKGLETMDLSGICERGAHGYQGMLYLDGLGIQRQTLLLIDEELLDVFTLVALKLDHLAHLGVVDDGAIAGC